MLHELVAIRVVDECRFVDSACLNAALSAEARLVRVEEMTPLRRRRHENPVVRKRLRRIEVEGEKKIAADKGQHLVGFVGKQLRCREQGRGNGELRFKGLGDFDEVMVKELAAPYRRRLGDRALANGATPVREDADGTVKLAANEPDKVLAFLRGDLLFAFNFNPTQSFTDYGILVPPASKWRHLFDTDEVRFGGQGRVQAGAVYEPALVHDSNRNELVQQIRLYLPARTAVVLKRVI